MDIKIIKSGISDVVAAVDSKLKGSMSAVADMKEAGWEKVSTMVNDTLGLAPLIEVTGFNMNEVSVDAGIPPGVGLSFIKEKEMDQEAVEKLLNENKDNNTLILIVSALQKADSIQKGMKLSDYKFQGLSMRIGLPPDISLKFSRNGQ